MTVIRAEDLSKLFYFNDARTRSIRDALTGLFTRSNRERVDHKLWALRDVSFSVESGETLGIIGRNGAGKSTLLKILSRITKPTSGSVEIRGRVGSLLEVGTGFHSELSGRENIYLNGAILGMRRTEIQAKFDEIVAFSEVEKFLDTPVKHYSSGMYMRLAFSIAAHLEPEVLIVDEVLAVGDQEFQKKCLGKMDEVKRTGRTVIFVSHQMASVAQLCRRSILLDNGSVIIDGPTEAVIERYVDHGRSNAGSYVSAGSKDLDMFVERADIKNESSVKQSAFRHDEAIVVNVRCRAKKLVRGAELRMVVRDRRGITVFTADAELGSLARGTEAFEVDFRIPAETLRPNSYGITLALFVPHQFIIELIEDVMLFTVFDAGSKYATSEGLDYGVIFSPCQTDVRGIR
jgi:lipopolysaccharide transport system ATP-binding protein